MASDNGARSQLIDLDGDGWPDLVIFGSPFRILFSRSGPEGEGRRFVEGAKDSGLAGRPHSMLLWGDVNGDGRLDAVSIVAQTAEAFAKDPQTYAVYLGDGRGHFARKQASGLEQAHHSATMSGVLADLDLDGKLDVAFANGYEDEKEGLNAQPMRVFQGRGDGTFIEVTSAWGFPVLPVLPGAVSAPRPLYGLTAADIDNDGYPDLLGAAYGRQWNTLWSRSPQRAVYGDFAATLGVDGDLIRHGRYPEGVRRPAELPFRANGNTFALVAADFDRDGDLDIFSAEITHAWAGESSDLSTLLVNRLIELGAPAFDRQLERLTQPDPATGRLDRPGLGLVRDHAGQTPQDWNQGDQQAHWADFDNDGLLDLLVCESDYPRNRLRLFMQQPDHTFIERSRDAGLDFPNAPGVALGDYDRDGRIDIIATGTTTRWPQARPQPELAWFENRFAPPQNGWLVVKLTGDGVTANTNAFGARLLLKTSDGRTQMRELSGPYGHWAAQTEPGWAHFGLGTALPESLTIVWPDAARTRTELHALARNTVVTLKQASPVALEE